MKSSERSRRRSAMKLLARRQAHEKSSALIASLRLRDPQPLFPLGRLSPECGPLRLARRVFLDTLHYAMGSTNDRGDATQTTPALAPACSCNECLSIHVRRRCLRLLFLHPPSVYAMYVRARVAWVHLQNKSCVRQRQRALRNYSRAFGRNDVEETRRDKRRGKSTRESEREEVSRRRSSSRSSFLPPPLFTQPGSFPALVCLSLSLSFFIFFLFFFFLLLLVAHYAPFNGRARARRPRSRFHRAEEDTRDRKSETMRPGKRVLSSEF